MGIPREEIVSELWQVDVLIAQGRQVADAARSIGVTEVTYCHWRNEYGGLKGDQAKRLNELVLENKRLRRAVSDLAGQADLVRGRKGKLLSPSRRRALSII